MAKERLSRGCGESWLFDGGNQCQAVNPPYGYEMAMAQGPNINRKRCFSSMQVQGRNPHCVIASCRHQLSRSSWAKQRLSSHLPWQQATWLTEGSEHCIALFQITVRSSLGPPWGAWELSYSITDYECLHSFRFFNAASAKWSEWCTLQTPRWADDEKDGDDDDDTKPTATFPCYLRSANGYLPPTPQFLRIKTADTQGEWSCVALYLEIGQDNVCCHRSWQAAKCNFCRIPHSGSTLQSRSSAAAPSSQSHPFANFFSPKNRTARQQDDRPHSTLRHRTSYRRGVLSRRKDISA